jgi:hypothetical protein
MAPMQTTAARGVFLSVIGAGLVLGYVPLKTFLTNTVTGHASSSGWIILALFASVVAVACRDRLEPALKFAWACFIQPLGNKGSQQDRLDKFYRSQADGEQCNFLCLCDAPWKILTVGASL